MAIQMVKGDASCFCASEQLEVLEKAGWKKKQMADQAKPAEKPAKAAKAEK